MIDTNELEVLINAAEAAVLKIEDHAKATDGLQAFMLRHRRQFLRILQQLQREYEAIGHDRTCALNHCFNYCDCDYSARQSAFKDKWGLR